ncbi:MAG: hypothetical protein U0R70_06450 [Solirubrobacteraceae bacterium]
MLSMTRIPRPLATLALGACAAMAFAVPGLAAKPANPGKPGKPGKTTIKVSRGATTLTLDTGVTTALSGKGVTIKVLKPARSTADGPAFPITQGRLTVTKANGTITGVTGAIAHTGGLQLSNGVKTVRLRNLVIKLDAKPDLTAQVKLGTGATARTSVFDVAPDLTKISVTGGKKKTVTATDVAVKLNAASAGVLHSYFGTSFAPGDTVGTAVVKTRIVG